MANLVMGKGPIPCDVMIIGEAPGETEDKLGEPFVGRAGKRLDEALIAAGLKRDEIYITNIYKHRPPGNRKPTKEEIDSHFGYLLEEFTQVNPSYVLLLGNTALETYSSETGIIRFRGMNLANGSKRLRVYATFHPSATFRSSEYKQAMFEDIADFARIIKSSYISSP